MLSQQRSVFDKEGLGYNMNFSTKYFKHYFVKASVTLIHPLFVIIVVYMVIKLMHVLLESQTIIEII